MVSDHEPGDVVGVFADQLQIHVTSDHAEQSNSYRTIATPGETSDRTGATVTVEAGHTYFAFRGDVFLFDGVKYRPNSEFRSDATLKDGRVRLVYPDGIHPDEGHPLERVSVRDFADMVTSGELEPTTNPDENGQ